MSVHPESRDLASLKRSKKTDLPKPVDENDREDQLFIDEVNEELKQERAAAFWKKYGRFIIIAVVGVLVAVGGHQYWRSSQKKAAEQASVDFAQASQLLAAGKTKDSLAAFQAIAAKKGGYAWLARLQAAAIMAKSGDRKGAVAAYRSLAQDTGADPVFKDVATVLWGLTGLGIEKPDTMIAALAPLRAENQRWRFTAREITALYEIRADRKAKALALFKALAADKAAPAALRVRANEMIAALSGS